MRTQANYFLLRGDEEALGEGELGALLDTYECRDAYIKCYTMLCIVSHNCNSIAEKIVKRAGFIKEAGLLLGVDNPFNPSISLDSSVLRGEEAHASILKGGVGESVAEKYVSWLREKYGVKAPSTGRGRIRVLFTDGLAVVGLKVIEQDSKSMYYRGGKYRPYKRSIALTPDISRLLINLTRIREGMLLLDPFAGTGSILIEAWSMNIRGIGIEIDWRLAQGMEENLEFYGSNAITILGDSTLIDLTSVDAIATDPPYGRGASTHGYDQLKLYEAFIEKSWGLLRSGGYMSFMSPLWLEDYVDELLCRYSFTSVARFYQYVHSGLTRVIYVVRRLER